MVTRQLLLVLSFFCFTISSTYSKAIKDTISIASNWNILKNAALSPNGKWAAIYQQYQNNADTLHIINTRSKNRITALGVRKFDFIGDNLFFIQSKDNKKIIKIDLQTGVTTPLANIKKYSILPKHNALAYLEKDTLLFHLFKLEQSKMNEIFQMDSITNYYTNEDQSYLIFVQKTVLDYKIYALNLKTLELSFLSNINSSPTQVNWGKNQTNLMLYTIDKDLLYFDLLTGTNKEIELNLNKKHILNIETVFITDSICSITILEDTGIKNDYSDVLEVWNGNDKNLNFVQEKKSSTIYQSHHFLYNTKTNEKITLEKIANVTKVSTNNPQHLILIDLLKHKDYTSFTPSADIYQYNINNHTIKPIAEQIQSINHNFSYSLDGKYIAYKKNENWSIFNSNEQKTIEINNISKQEKLFWSTTSDEVFLVADGNLWLVDILTQQKRRLTNFLDSSIKITILNYLQENKSIPIPNINEPSYIKSDQNILLHTIDSKDNSHSIWSITNDYNCKLIYKTFDKISNIQWSENYNTISFSQENYNKPPMIKVVVEKQVSTLIESNVPKQLYSWRKQLIIDYKDKYGTPLKGILYYPKNFTSEKKYPMITHVYQRQFQQVNTFYQPTFKNSIGFNIPLLNELDYFVFLPDIVISKQGPGLAALDCVTRAIKSVLKEEPAINSHSLGLIGQSFGGYETNFIISQTNIFKAAVSGAAINNLVWDYYSYGYNFQKPYYWRYEDVGQVELRTTFANSPNKYLANSPIIYAHQIKTPLLSWTGLDDYNVHWEHTRHFFIALKRYKIPTIALFYKNEGHSLSNTNSTKDLTLRTIDWFNYYLNQNKDITWINQGVK